MIIDYSIQQFNKQGKILCGDSIEVFEDENSKIFVLSDGLGSGVKANISSTYTKIILSKFLMNNLPLEQCVKVLKNILPTCRERKIAYSTFTVIQIFNDLRVRIIEYDNPLVFYFNHLKLKEYERKKIVCEGEDIFISDFRIEKDDFLVLASDGLVQAGRGKLLKDGWGWDRVALFLEQSLQIHPSSENISHSLIHYAKYIENGSLSDDITILVINPRDRVQLNIAIGPPKSESDDKKYVETFCACDGQKILCGGTTAKVFARVLNRKLTVDQNQFVNDIPAKSHLDGFDLVSEGVLTLEKVVKWFDFTHEFDFQYEYIKSLHDINKIYGFKTPSQNNIKEIKLVKREPDNPVEEIIFMLKKADDINFFLGKASNYNNGKYSSDEKNAIINKLIEKLKEQNKNVTVTEF